MPTLQTNLSAVPPVPTPEVIEDEEMVECEVCGNDVVESSASSHGAFDSVCDSCQENRFATCSHCEEAELSDDMYDVEGDRLCSACYEDQTSECDSCNRRCYDSNINDDGHCERCAGNDSIVSRNYSRDVIYDDKKGKIVKSMRTFGVEIECDMNKYNEACKVSKKLPKTCGISGDGSVGGSIPKELQTPPLQGASGEEYIKTVCTLLKECDTRVDRSCGLHVHIGAEDYVGNYGKLKELFMFYIYSEDVIYSFLPKSRWGNRYCKKLADMYYADEIEQVKSLARFEEVYYREQRPDRRDSRKKHKYDEARYTGVNFHALFHNGHTIEIRSHSGTTASNKILNWVALHTSIMDFIISNDNWENADTKILFDRTKTMKQRTKAFFKVIKMSDDVEDYFLKRQKQFLELFGKNDSFTSNHTYDQSPRRTAEGAYTRLSEMGINLQISDMNMFQSILNENPTWTTVAMMIELKKRKKKAEQQVEEYRKKAMKDQEEYLRGVNMTQQDFDRLHGMVNADVPYFARSSEEGYALPINRNRNEIFIGRSATPNEVRLTINDTVAYPQDDVPYMTDDRSEDSPF